MSVLIIVEYMYTFARFSIICAKIHVGLAVIVKLSSRFFFFNYGVCTKMYMYEVFPWC